MGKKWVREAREAKYAPLDQNGPRKKGDKRRSKSEYETPDLHDTDWQYQDRSRYDDR